MVNLVDSLYGVFFGSDRLGLESFVCCFGEDGRKCYYQMEIRNYFFMVFVLDLKGKVDWSRVVLFLDVIDEDFLDFVFDVMVQVYQVKINDKYFDELLELYVFCFNKSILMIDFCKKGF